MIIDTTGNWCPMEGTQYEGYCKELNVMIRPRETAYCVHAPECRQMKETFDTYDIENKYIKKQ